MSGDVEEVHDGGIAEIVFVGGASVAPREVGIFEDHIPHDQLAVARRTAEEAPGDSDGDSAGVGEVDGHLVTAGGRVLTVTGQGATVAEARDRAYAAVGMISWPGMHHRTDIAGTVVAGAGTG